MSTLRFAVMVGAAAACLAAAAYAESQAAVSVFRDRAFEHGFKLSAVDSSLRPLVIRDILARDASAPPVWRLAQWGTRFNLESAQLERLPDGSRQLANPGKSVRVYPGGLAGEGILLAVHGGVEYNNTLRKRGEAWPHLLIEQNMAGRLSMEGVIGLDFRVEFRVEHCAPTVEEGLERGLHTAHINAFWTVHNRNPESPDYKDMIWFGVPLFDARYPIPPGHQALDIGKADATGKFICTIAGKEFYDEPVVLHRWHSLSCDLLPHLRNALAASQKHGYLKTTAFEDLEPTSFNLGWEVPGPYDCAIRLRGLDLVARRAKAPDE